jgi:hypothetical protein
VRRRTDNSQKLWFKLDGKLGRNTPFMADDRPLLTLELGV